MTQANDYVPGSNGSGFQSSSATGAAPASSAAPTTSLHPHQQKHSTPMNYFINQQQPTQQQQQQQPQPHQAQAPAQQQQFLPGPFYTLQQQQAFAQARLSAAAQAQEWQQKQQQQQQQAHLHGTTGQQPQQQRQVVYPTFSHVGNQPGGQQQVGLSSLLSASSTTVPLHSVSIPTAIPTLIRNRGQLPVTKTTKDDTATIVASLPPNNNSNKSMLSSKKIPLTIIKKKSTIDKAAVVPPTGMLPDSIASTTSGMCASAALLIQNALDESNNCGIPPLECSGSTEGGSSTDPKHITDGSITSYVSIDGNNKPTSEQRKQTSRDRNREHARCTRLRKKAYVDKLKELVDGLHTKRNEDSRKRRVAIQQLAEIHALRRRVVHTFLDYHAKFEVDYNKWALILECSSSGDDGNNTTTDGSGSNSNDEEFFFKQPVTPYRSFRRSEIQKGNRILRGIDAMIRDSASMSVMIENIGSRNSRWLDRKRHDYLSSSRSCSTEKQMMLRTRAEDGAISYNNSAGYQISSSDGSSSNEGKDVRQQLLRDQHHGAASNEVHDYNAPSLLDPLPGHDDMSVTSGSSGDEVKGHDSTDPDSNPTKKRKLRTDTKSSSEVLAAGTVPRAAVPPPSHPPRLNGLPSNIARSGGIAHNVKVMVPLPVTITAGSTTTSSVTTMSSNSMSLPSNGKTNLIRAPAVSLPPFVGIGKKKPPSSTMKSNTISGVLSSSALKLAAIATPQQPPVVRASVSATNHSNNEDTTSSSDHKNANNNNNSPSSKANIITIDNDTSSNYSPHQSSSSPQNHHRHADIQAKYHINEDVMILTDDVLMCPFVFKSQEAVYCGAHTECIQHGMLRATFSPTNRLCNVEMIFDAMGFCQQLERASGNDGRMAQIIPNSLEMALLPNSEEGRVITLAEPPFLIVSVNEIWTSITGYTQVDAEGKDLSTLLYGGNSSSRQQQDFENVTRGICCASTNIHADKSGRQFLNFMCSYPLSNLCDEVTHILHVCKEL